MSQASNLWEVWGALDCSLTWRSKSELRLRSTVMFKILLPTFSCAGPHPVLQYPLDTVLPHCLLRTAYSKQDEPSFHPRSFSNRASEILQVLTLIKSLVCWWSSSSKLAVMTRHSIPQSIPISVAVIKQLRHPFIAVLYFVHKNATQTQLTWVKRLLHLPVIRNEFQREAALDVWHMSTLVS